MLTIKLSTPKTTIERDVAAKIIAANPNYTDAQVLAYAQEHAPSSVQRVKGGTVCVYGLNSKFPVALHPNQWEELAPYMPAILQFIAEGRKNGTIVDREEREASTNERVPLKRVDPVVAAIMAAKGVDATEATRIAKASGFLK